MASLTGGFKGAAIAALPLDGTGMLIDVGAPTALCSLPS